MWSINTVKSAHHLSRDANWKYTEIASHLSQNGYQRETPNHKCWGRCRERWPLSPYWVSVPRKCLWQCKTVQLLWESIWRLLIKPKWSYGMIQLGNYLRESKLAHPRDEHPCIHTATLFTIAEIRSILDNHQQWMSGWGKCTVCTPCSFTQP